MKLPIKELRRDKGLTQAEFGKIMDVAPSTIGMWEQGYREPDFDFLNKIADYFNVSVDYLLGRKAEKPLMKEENSLVDGYRTLNAEGKNTLMAVLQSLMITQSVSAK